MQKRSSIDTVAEIMTAATAEEKPTKNPAAVALGRLGGLKGGKARAKSLTAAEKSVIARMGAEARWSRHEGKHT
jgi:hypothetical protein